MRHLYGYISGTGSGRHIYFKLDLWAYCSLQTSPGLFKSVQPSSRIERLSVKDHIHTYIHAHIHTRTHTHTQTFSDLVELSRMVYNTRGLRGSEAILYPWSLKQFYILSIEKGKTEICRLRHLYGYISGTGSVCHVFLNLICSHVAAFKPAQI